MQDALRRNTVKQRTYCFHKRANYGKYITRKTANWTIRQNMERQICLVGRQGCTWYVGNIWSKNDKEFIMQKYKALEIEVLFFFERDIITKSQSEPADDLGGWNSDWF